MTVSTAKLCDFSDEQYKDIRKLLSTDKRFYVYPSASGLVVLINNTNLFTYRSIDKSWNGGRFKYVFKKMFPDKDLPEEALSDFKSYVLNRDNTDLIASVMNDEFADRNYKLKTKNSSFADDCYSAVTFNDCPVNSIARIDVILVHPSKKVISLLCTRNLQYSLIDYYKLLETADIVKLKKYILKLFNINRKIRDMPYCNIPAEEFEISVNTVAEIKDYNETEFDSIIRSYKISLSKVPEIMKKEIGWCVCYDYSDIDLSKEAFTPIMNADLEFKNSIAERYNIKTHALSGEEIFVNNCNAESIGKRFCVVCSNIDELRFSYSNTIHISAVMFENGKAIDELTAQIQSADIPKRKRSKPLTTDEVLRKIKTIDKGLFGKLVSFLGDALYGDTILCICESEYLLLQKLFAMSEHKACVRYVDFHWLSFYEIGILSFDNMLDYFGIPKQEDFSISDKAKIEGRMLLELLKLFDD